MTKPARLLVVEDHPPLAWMISENLSALGYETVGVARGGAEAIALAEATRPDLVLLDVNLADQVDGLTVAETLRLRFGIRAVIVTGVPISVVMARADRASPVGILSKPFNVPSLHSTIEMALHLRDVQAQLHQNQQTLDAILQTAPDGLIVTDRLGRILEANDATARLSGLSRAELATCSLLEVFPGETAATAMLVEKLASRAPRFVHHAATHDGRQLEITFCSQWENQPVGSDRFVGFVHDVTVQARTEHRLRLLFRAVEQSPASIVITDASGRIEYVNPRFESMTGYTAAEAVGSNPRVLSAGSQPREFYTDLWETILSGREWRGEFHNRRKNGELFWESASISPVRNAAGRITHFIAVKEDITAQKENARELELRHSYLQAIIENQPGPVWLRDNDGRGLAVNSAYAVVMGRGRPEEIVGRRPEDVWPAKFGALLTRIHAQVRECGATRFSLNVPMPDGRFRWVEVYETAARDTNGESIGIVGCARDISLDREMEVRMLASAHALAASNERLQTALARQSELAREAMLANRAKTTFLASMSHELRSPLNVINGLSATMLREAPGTPAAESAGLILECGEHLLGIIQEILDYSVLQGGHARLDPKPCDPRALIDAVLRQAGVSAREKGLALTQRIAPALPPAFEVDGRRLQQILLNLLQNAVKFTAAGGVHLRVRTRALHDGRHRCTFSVFDTGIGVSRAQADKLFHPFKQATDEIAHTYGGTGLGLAISRQFARMMGGDIVVRSSPGRGSCFQFTFVVRALAEDALAPGPAKANSRGSAEPAGSLAARFPLRILAADDIRTNREVLRRMTAHFGYTPVLCQNGVEVLTALARESFDLLLLDVQMPVMDGFTTAREIRRLYPEAGRRPRIVALTANALPEDREKCLAAGMDDYLAKPLLPEHLEACILHWFAAAPILPRPPLPSSPAARSDAAPAGLPLVDQAHYAAAFPGLGGEALGEILLQIRAAALTDYEAVMVRLEAACTNRDGAAVATELHALKGCFLTIGWRRLAAFCAETLELVRAEKFCGWTSLPTELRALCAESNQAMSAFLAEFTTTADPGSTTSSHAAGIQTP